MTAKPSPNFRTLLKSAANQEKVVPLLRNALWDPDFESFTIKVEGFEERPPDGWFHPSIHTTWTEVMLYYYLENFDRMVREPFDPQSTIAVTAGSFFHTFTQVVLVRAGVLVKQPEICDCGHRHPERAEVYLVDEEVGSRGHADGVLTEGPLFEFKTMNPAKMYHIPKAAPDSPEVLAWFKDRNPGYYGQAQEYLRMSGKGKSIVVLMSLTYPFEMREIHVPYVRSFAMETRNRFARVRQAIADDRPPACECGPTNKQCPARLICFPEFH